MVDSVVQAHPRPRLYSWGRRPPGLQVSINDRLRYFCSGWLLLPLQPLTLLLIDII
jgi:hypothetical protein